MSMFVMLGAGLRAAMQFIPSVEPVTFFAVLAGWLFGSIRGFMVGATTLYVSNFLVFGGQGPWTPFQAISFGIAGLLGGLISKRMRYIEAIGCMLAATIVFELIMNLFSGIFFGGNILLAFFTAGYFIVVHVISNISFALLMPVVGRKMRDFGGFHEKGFISRVAGTLARLDGTVRGFKLPGTNPRARQ